MLIPPRVLNVARSASRDATRYQLQGVLLERQAERICSATATDGKVLAHVRWMEDDCEEFPEVEGVDPSRREGTRALIPLDEIKGIQKLAAKKPAKPILENVAMSETKDGAKMYFAGTDLDRRQRLEVKEIMGTFPDYAQAFKKRKPTVSVLVNPEILIQALQTLRDSMPGDQGVVGRQQHTFLLEVWNDKEGNTPIRISEARYGAEGVVLAMPIVQNPPPARCSMIDDAPAAQEAAQDAAPPATTESTPREPRTRPRANQAGSRDYPPGLTAGQKAALTRRRNREAAAAAGRGAA